MAANLVYFFACLWLCQANPLYPSSCEIPNLSGIKPCEKSSSFNYSPYGLVGPLGLGLNNIGPIGSTVHETPNVYNGFNGYTLGLNGPGSNVIEAMPPISVGMDMASLSRLFGTPMVEAMPSLSLNIPKGLGTAPVYEATAIGVGSVGYGPVYETPIIGGVGYNVAPMYETPAIGLGNFAPIYEPVVGIGGLGYGFGNVAPIYEQSIPIGSYGNVGPIFEPAVGYGGLSYGLGGFGVNNVTPMYETPVWPGFGSVGYGVGNVGPIFETPVAVGGVGYGLGNVSPVYETNGGIGYGLGGLYPQYPYTGLGKPIFT